MDSNTRLLIVEEGQLQKIIHDEVTRALQESNKEVREQASGTYTRKEASGILKISLPTLDKLVENGQLHPTKVGKRVLFRKLEVESLISCNA